MDIEVVTLLSPAESPKSMLTLELIQANTRRALDAHEVDDNLQRQQERNVTDLTDLEIRLIDVEFVLGWIMLQNTLRKDPSGRCTWRFF